MKINIFFRNIFPLYMKTNQVLIFRAFTKSQLRSLIIHDLKVCTFDASLNITKKNYQIAMELPTKNIISIMFDDIYDKKYMLDITDVISDGICFVNN